MLDILKLRIKLIILNNQNKGIKMKLTKIQRKELYLVNKYLIDVRKKSIEDASYAIMTMLLVEGLIPENLVENAKKHFEVKV